MTMRSSAVMLVLALLDSTGTAAQTLHECVVLYDVSAKATWQSDADECATQLSPASTFKIPHALVALETGVVTPVTIEKWDGTAHPQQPLWNRDHTVLSAMKPSVLWFFQRIAPRIGAERMQSWLTKMEYGNGNVSGDITRYWVNGTLRVSPVEQVRFLHRFYARELPVSGTYARLVENALTQTPGTIQNARGVHTLAASWPPGALLNAKTGATTIANGESVSWLVGALDVSGRRHVFASAVWRERGGVDQLDAARLAVKTFDRRGLCRCR
jgi:beta-lactamase class D